MKIRASEVVIGYRFEGAEVISIDRGVGGLLITTTATIRKPQWFNNGDKIEVNDR